MASTDLKASEKQIGFAEYLIQKEAYESGIQEFYRFLYLYPDHPRIPYVQFRIGEVYLLLNRYPAAIEAFTAAVAQKKDFYEASFKISLAHLKQKDYDAAILVLKDLIQKTTTPSVKDRAYQEIGRIYLASCRDDWNMNRLNQILDQAIDSLHQVHSPHIHGADRLMDLAEQLREKPEQLLDLKKPWLAGSLGIIPGAGYFYLNRYQDAWIAFVLNTGVMLATHESFADENYALGGVLSLLGVGFYGGSILGTVSSAYEHNRRQIKGYIDDCLDPGRLGISVGHWERGTRIKLTYRY